MNRPLRVLIVEDSKADAELLLIELREGGYDPASQRVDTPEAMSEALEKQEWDIVLSDYVMPSFDGLGALKLLQARGIDIPFIVVSGQIGEDVAVATMKAGAHDYILKGHYTRLVPAIERELSDAEVRRERRKAEEERARLAEQLRQVNEQLVVGNIRAQEQSEIVQRQTAELEAIIAAVAEPLEICGPNGEIFRMNPAAEELLGYSTADREKPLMERLALLRITTTDGKPFPLETAPITRALLGETVRGVVMTVHRRSDARPARVSASAAPIRTADGKLWGAVAVFADISTLREQLS